MQGEGPLRRNNYPMVTASQIVYFQIPGRKAVSRSYQQTVHDDMGILREYRAV